MGERSYEVDKNRLGVTRYRLGVSRVGYTSLLSENSGERQDLEWSEKGENEKLGEMRYRVVVGGQPESRRVGLMYSQVR